MFNSSSQSQALLNLACAPQAKSAGHIKKGYERKASLGLSCQANQLSKVLLCVSLVDINVSLVLACLLPSGPAVVCTRKHAFIPSSVRGAGWGAEKERHCLVVWKRQHAGGDTAFPLPPKQSSLEVFAEHRCAERGWR